MKRLWGVLIMLIMLAFSLPVMIHAIEALIPALIAGTILVTIGTILFQRRRRW